MFIKNQNAFYVTKKIHQVFIPSIYHRNSQDDKQLIVCALSFRNGKYFPLSKAEHKVLIHRLLTVRR